MALHNVTVSLSSFFQNLTPYVGSIGLKLNRRVVKDGVLVFPITYQTVQFSTTGAMTIDLVPNALLGDDTCYIFEVRSTEGKITGHGAIFVPDADCDFLDYAIFRTSSSTESAATAQGYASLAKQIYLDTQTVVSGFDAHVAQKLTATLSSIEDAKDDAENDISELAATKLAAIAAAYTDVQNLVTSASNYATQAASSATVANGYKTDAANSADAAAGYKNQAADSAASAELAKLAAVTANLNATGAAASASESAQTALASSQEAVNSAASATADATLATQAKNIAVSSRDEALLAKADAANSATVASTAASQASANATTASEKSAEASSFATSAAESADSASESASSALSSKADAESAKVSAVSASESASASASSASVSKASASASASSAATSESNAASSALSASTSASNAASSEASAASSAESAEASATSATASAATASEAAQELTGHNTSPEAHADIRGDVSSLNSGYASLLNSLNGAEKRVRILEKTVQNLEDASKGKIADDVTDDRLLHTKTLGDPEKCGLNTQVLPNGELLSIGGRTVVWNQYGYIYPVGNYIRSNIPNIAYSDGVYSGNFNSVNQSFNIFYMSAEPNNQRLNFTVGHKVYISVEIQTNTECRAIQIFDGASWIIVNANADSKWHRYSTIIDIKTFTSNPSGAPFRICQSSSSNIPSDSFANWKNLIAVDLTQMFGAGNEPTSIDAFEALFDTSVYHPYNAGTLMSLPVKSVVTQGANFITAETASYTSSNITLDIYDNPKIVLNGTIQSSLSASDTRWRKIVLDIKNTGTYYVSFNATPSIPVGTTIGIYDFGTYNMVAVGKGAKTLQKGKYHIGVYIPSGTYSNLTIEPCIGVLNLGGEFYSPFCRTSLVIPQSVKALTGYGWSAGSVCNEVDWQNKQYVQRVGSVNLGSLSWYNAYPDYNIRTAIIPNGKHGNIVCSNYTTTAYRTSEAPDKSIRFSDSYYGNGRAAIRDSAFQSSGVSILNGVIAYYELAEPIITDISDILPDNLLSRLETGGTVTFVADGVAPDGTTVLTSDEQSLPVPNSIAYQTKIAS